MRNIFIAYMAPGNYEQMVHYQDTIKNKVPRNRLFQYLDRNIQNILRNIFTDRPVTVWGSRDTKINRGRFENMSPGDDILIIEGDTIKLLGKIAATAVNSDLSRELWKNLAGDTTTVWSLIYFIANPIEIDLPFTTINSLFGYRRNYRPQGFTGIAHDKLEEFYGKYDDLYSILLRIKQGQQYEVRNTEEQLQVKEDIVVELQPEDVEEILKEKELSDHVRIQWKLVHLGLKTGAKVWIPRNDQPKIQREFDFSDFEPTFSSGIDMPARYVENIDVVWKEEFRIDAAFEVEHSTAIYSGLLRFADLKIIAPNINYPLFIVAPTAKKNRVFDQLKRPSFKKLGMDKEVRYLSYEAIDDIDKFFESSNSGLSVDLIVGKSEAVR
ncbi:MAG: hypothetical protein HZB62_00200 [Nitrospirae bacterium]|nr:hypothetical protein [Nitrospirota bacterium]